MKILVTGGAGYIGSHVVRGLVSAGHQPIVLDDMSLGNLAALGNTALLEIDMASPEAKEFLITAFKDHEIEGVIHLAARKSVGESVTRPEYYYQQNINSVNNLLFAMKESGIYNLVFSSSAATYGSPDVPVVDEDCKCNPINPYGETKLIGEWMIADSVRAWGLKAMSLRYFNVAGAGYKDLADTAGANLIPIAFTAINTGRAIQVFGTDWPTPDGSCVRDYIHVSDLAAAHISALEHLTQSTASHMVLNVGSGKGSSVLEVIQAIRDVTKLDFVVENVPARAGDPASLCADVSKIERVLGWKAKHSFLEIVASHWDAISQ
ncbi:MAG: UDP-glucose 4-epimerase GalE [Actinomycetes bacterium]